MFFPAGAADITPFIDSVHQVLSIQSASVSALPVRDRLPHARARKVKVNALLGPKPAVEIADGKPMIGKRPNRLHASDELTSLKDMRVKYLALRDITYQPGIASHPTYMIADGKTALICSGTLSASALQRDRNVCVKSNEPANVKALAALFCSKFDETLSPARKQEFDRIARSRLIVCPSCEDALLAELMDADELTLRVAGFGSLPKIEARLLQLGGRLRVLLPLPYRSQHPFEETLRRAGAQIRFVDESVVGLMWSSRTKTGTVRAIVGSMQLNANSLSRSREVGVRLDGELAMEVEQMLAKTCLSAK